MKDNRLLIIIFSFNRAMQLNALLSSMLSAWRDMEIDIKVLFNYSNKDFLQGYQHLIKSFEQIENITFLKEEEYTALSLLQPHSLSIPNVLHVAANRKLWKYKTNFRKIILQELSLSNAQNIMFLTDDSVFITEIDIDMVSLNKWLFEKPNSRQFALRFGKEMIAKTAVVRQGATYMEWNIADYPFLSDMGYPFSVDGHIYNCDSMRKLLEKQVFANPNSLEGYVSARARRSHFFTEIRCAMKPYLLSYPLNMVQTDVNNQSQNLSVEYLNNLYLDGWCLEYPITTIDMTSFQQYPKEITLVKNDEVRVIALRQPK